MADSTITLAEISEFLQFRLKATSQDFARHFKSTPAEMELQLEPWVQQNKLSKKLLSNCCESGCEVCDTSMSEYYQLIES